MPKDVPTANSTATIATTARMAGITWVKTATSSEAMAATMALIRNVMMRTIAMSGPLR